MSQDTWKKAFNGAREIVGKGIQKLNKRDALAVSSALVEKSGVCLLGTNGEDGFPNIKAMLNTKHDGLKKIWFATGTSSRKVQQIKKDNRACVYFLDEVNFQGLMLCGTIEILQDIASKKFFWKKGMEAYYPQGVNDPDYTVLCFTAQQANYYHGLTNITFKI
jgi:general stress protein 26